MLAVLVIKKFKHLIIITSFAHAAFLLKNLISIVSTSHAKLKWSNLNSKKFFISIRIDTFPNIILPLFAKFLTFAHCFAILKNIPNLTILILSLINK